MKILLSLHENMKFIIDEKVLYSGNGVNSTNNIDNDGFLK